MVQEDTSDDLRLYQVRRIAPGSSLAQLVAAGWRATEAEIVSVAKQVREWAWELHEFILPNCKWSWRFTRFRGEADKRIGEEGSCGA